MIDDGLLNDKMSIINERERPTLVQQRKGVVPAGGDADRLPAAEVRRGRPPVAVVAPPSDGVGEKREGVYEGVPMDESNVAEAFLRNFYDAMPDGQ